MMNGFGLMLDARNRNDALREVRKWVDKELGEQTPVIKVEENKTTVTLPDGRIGVSRCNPCDKFDIITGIRVALDDIERKSMKLNDEEIMCLKVAKKAGAKYVRIDKYECSINDIFMTTNKTTNEENVVLYIEDDKMFLSLDSDKFYDIDTLLNERG